ncbi:hypothetical protein C5167_031261 [Papaver somniferum]|nr:hypothetical protein C5167_031261 [Papaver somniferum]
MHGKDGHREDFITKIRRESSSQGEETLTGGDIETRIVIGCVSRNLERNAVELGDVRLSTPPNDENFESLTDEIMENNMELRIGDGPLGDIFPVDTIALPVQYLTRT